MKNALSNKKVFVSGCYDLIHSGHIHFFEQASRYGDLYVSIASNKTILDLKKRKPITTENERLFHIRSIKYVFKAFVSRGTGMMNFLEDFIKIEPDFFVVNEDGDKSEKKQLCHKYGVNYIVLKREPKKGLPARSSSELYTLIASTESDAFEQ